MSLNTRSRLLKFAGVGAIAATALATAPMSMAATSGGVGINASAAQAKSAPFTLGVSAKTVKPGQKITVSGLAYARAGENVTIMSRAISSGRTVSGIPAVQTPAFVEGTYRTTVRISPSTKPGVYPVTLRFGNRQVASINNLTVVPAAARSGHAARLNACDGSSFGVLHNDRAGSAYLPAGRYTVSSNNMDCGSASADFTSFLAGAGKPIAGWTTASTAAGRATFTQTNSGLSFSVAKAS
jgi:hypothetical protein